MGRLAILCSGQGTQTPDMFALVAQAPEAAPVFEAARDALGADPREVVHSGEIHTNKVGQILCCTQALAAYAALGTISCEERVIAGYSVGELAAWGVAGLIAPRELMDLAIARAQAMDHATHAPSALAALSGLSRQVVESLCAGRDAYIAIVNGADRFIVGGTREALAAVLADGERRGAQRASLLQVEVASHTPLLADAALTFAATLEGVILPKRMPQGIRLLSGIDAAQVHDARAGSRKLARQIGETIDWAGCLDACVSIGVDTVLELGPGAALSRMMQEVAPGLRVRALADFRTLEGVKAWLAR